MIEKIKYLTNKEFLLELHKSKNSYCSYLREEDSEYDYIVKNYDEITFDLIQAIRRKKADALMNDEISCQRKLGIVSSERIVTQVETNSIPATDCVIRCLTYDHIPIDMNRKRKNTTTGLNHTLLNFPPFKHYRPENVNDIKETFDLREVGRSHWTGSFSNGEFCKTQGKMTPRLAMMFMLLVERYSRRSNFNGYSYVDELRGNAMLNLAQIGLQFNEALSSNPFAFYTTAVQNSFVKILNNEKKHQMIRDDLITVAGLIPSYTRQSDDAWERRTEGKTDS